MSKQLEESLPERLMATLSGGCDFWLDFSPRSACMA
jgi:hypothetical protein